ncbi:hypothetical protein EP47_11615 [Legionella norrlandica]|uniref:Uncharacterized protein n=1 Tax=Legionella norrlandica TaxID=1498499 RepID=A0A0A2SXH8_9GAMM|nr:Mth938-like domain-containing protein [Legionella norrlandica]KGP64411.1 hypothetical protein EP47_11615 [Legionella norrlandica]
MNINLENAEEHAVQAYSDKKIQINSIVYEASLIVSRKEIITDFAIKDILEINDHYIDLLLRSNPELIIIGHHQTGRMLPITLISELSQKRIGIECMSIGAACRTYNVLLGENRAVVAGLIL